MDIMVATYSSNQCLFRWCSVNPIGKSGPIFGLGTKFIPSIPGIVVFELGTITSLHQNINMRFCGLVIFLVRWTRLKKG